MNEPTPEMKASLAKIGEQMAAEWEKTAGADGQDYAQCFPDNQLWANLVNELGNWVGEIAQPQSRA